MNRVDLLRAHVDSAAASPVVVGESDCYCWVAKWVKIASGLRVDIPRYSTHEEGYALIAKDGGAVTFSSNIMARAGLFTTDYPQYGDIGIVRLGRKKLPVVFLGNGYVLIRGDSKNVYALHAPAIRAEHILIAWRVP